MTLPETPQRHSSECTRLIEIIDAGLARHSDQLVVRIDLDRRSISEEARECLEKHYLARGWRSIQVEQSSGRMEAVLRP
jgi:hypothetical protein